MNIRTLIGIFILHFTALYAWGAKPIDLQGIAEEYMLKGADFDYYEDSSHGVNIESILQQQNQLFTTNTLSLRLIENIGSNYWIRLYFKDSEHSAKKVLEVITPQTEFVTFYAPKENGSYDSSQAGYRLPFTQREYEHKNLVFDFQEDTDFSKPFFIKVRSSNKVALLFKIRSQQFFTAYSLKEYFTLGLYYGTLALLILYNLILFTFVRKPVYLAYVFVVVFAIGLSMSDDGMGFALLWPNHPEWSQTLGLKIFPLGFLLCYTIYAVQFLDMKFIKSKRVILIATTLYTLYFLFNIFFNKDKFYYSYAYSIPFIIIYSTYWFVVLKHNFRAGRFFIIGNTFALMGVVIEQLRLLGVVEGTIFTVYAFEVGILIEFISLSLSLSYQYASDSKMLLKTQLEKVSLLKKNEEVQQEKIKVLKEKELLSQKVNNELEQKVKERTIEVQQANDKLSRLVTSLEAMSITLDKENWQLKRVLREEKKSRLTNNIMSLEEVYTLFPSRLSCLDFLATLKWQNGYICPKCHNDKSSINKKEKSRKCSKCGKIVSVTSGSLLHAQKLPLQVLFLLTHLSFGEYPINVANISKETEISESSIYKFLAKVKQRKTERKKARSWEELIF